MDDERSLLLARVSRLYYLEDRSQNEIADLIGISRSAISRMLTEARRTGIVKIEVHQPLLRIEAIEQELQTRFGLPEAAVVDPGSNASDAEKLHLAGQMAAALLSRHLTQISVLGISWGTAVAATVDALPSMNLPNLQVVQIIGAAGPASNLTDTPDLAVRAAQKLGGQFRVLTAPMLVENATVAKSLLSNRTVAEALELASKADIALVGIGSTNLQVSSVLRAGYVNQEYVEMLRAQGAVGDVCGLYYDQAGNFLDIEAHHRRIGISREWLVDHVQKVIAVAVGKPKLSAVFGALAGRRLGTLVTDRYTAEELLAFVPEANGSRQA
ncbi:MAG: sugar-binding transcriptional regulator [Anaerolineae bacterium]|nr:sugar-binding transcriptional regulator [Anaerolineae bacterium]